jgi:type IV pilus assembly protein PilC
MLYTYTAKNTKGEVYTGEVEVAGKSDLYTRVRNEGGRLLTVKENGVKKTLMFSGIFGRVNTHDKIIFAKNLSSMLKAGLPVVRALEVMEKQSKKNSLKVLLADLRQDVQKGISLSETLNKKSKIFPAIFSSMVKAGEESGKLSEALEVVGSQMEKSYELAKRVRGALIYPE